MEQAPQEIKDQFLENYDLYSDAIFRYCLFQTSNREVALDLTQDTFMKAWEYMAKGNTIDHMRAFLYRIAGNLVIDYRRKKKSSSLDSMTEAGFDIGTDETGRLATIHDGKQILELVNNIDEKYRDVIIMRYVDDLSIKEIAYVTGESENNISVRIHRGLEKVRALYEEQDK